MEPRSDAETPSEQEQHVKSFSGLVFCEGGARLAMTDGKLSRDQIRRRILDNLSWGDLPNLVIEPLPPVAVPPPPPSIPVAIAEAAPERPRSLATRVAKKLITSVPFLGRAAIVFLTPLLWSLSVTGTQTSRLQSLTRKIENLIP
jgi:hypothetical protein